MNNEMKPVQCGCGGEAEIFHIAPDEGCEGSYCVRCSECLTQTPFFSKDKEKAITAWNKAMSSKDINVFTKERTAKVISHDGIITVNGYGYHYEEYLCNACKNNVFSCDSYCSSCGAKLDWSGNE